MSFLFLIVAQLELGLTCFTEDPRCKLSFTENSTTYNSMLCVRASVDSPTSDKVDHILEDKIRPN